MSLFIKKISIFILLLLVLLHLSFFVLTRNQYLTNLLPGAEIYKALIKSAKKINHRKIVLGDSVAIRFFNEFNQKNSEYYHLASNQGISMVGQYILVQRILEHNPEFKGDICLMLIPESFKNNLDQPWTFTTFVLPFLNNSNKKYLTEYATSLMRRYKFYFIGEIPAFKVLPRIWKIDYSRYNRRTSTREKPYLSQLSIEYIKKLWILSRQRGFGLKIVSGPLSDHFSYDFTTMRRQIGENHLEDVFREYFNRLIILPDRDFSDHIHPTHQFLQKNRQLLIERLLEDL